MPILSLGLSVVSLIPRVEDPWPDSIGLDFPFVLSGSFAVVAGILNVRAPKERRDRAISHAGAGGFLLGVATYLVALAIQVGSNI